MIIDHITADKLDHAPEEITIDCTKYRLTLEDNFDGDDINPKIWARCPEDFRANYGGRWNDAMTTVKNGKLALCAALNDEGKPISGAIRTKGLFEQTRGYFEAKIMAPPKCHGFWGAFWMMCGRPDKPVGGENGMEIDIIETYERKVEQANHALCWNGYGDEARSTKKMIGDISLYEGWHTYAVRWTKDEYIFMIDGKDTWHTTDGGICTLPGYMKLTIEFGSHAGKIVPETLPEYMYVDWVRVYQEV